MVRSGSLVRVVLRAAIEADDRTVVLAARCGGGIASAGFFRWLENECTVWFIWQV
jgi:hypothetical protein